MQTDTHKTVPRARPGDVEMIPNEKIEMGSQSDGRERGGKERRAIMRSERPAVIDWIHHQVAILGFNQPSKHTEM